MPSDKFKLFLNSAAKTKKEIEDEVKRLIRSRIENVVGNAIRDATDSLLGGEKIPPRDSVSYYREKKPDDKAHLSADDLAYAHDTPYDSPITEKIRSMRELGQTIYNGYMLRQCAEITIVKQGEFMKDVTDDFPRTAFCSVERPVYGALSLEQLRTYFTWRTDVRRGIYRKTDKPYIMLYCYELLNKIGVISAEDSLNRLIGVWENCRSFCPHLDKVMPMWISDLYAFNHIDADFSVYSDAFPVTSENTDKMMEELLSGNYAKKLDYLIKCSSYDLKSSIFFKEDNMPQLMDEAIEIVLKALNRYFHDRDIPLFGLICGRPKKDFNWTPFAGAYVDLDRMDGFRTCKVSAVTRYCTKMGKPALERFEFAPYRSFIGYILKATEAALRKRVGFRYGISANTKNVLEDFMNRDKLYRAASEPQFASLITDTVNSWCDKKGIFPPKKTKKKAYEADLDERYCSSGYGPSAPPKDVEIDISGLEQIRRESEEIARKLIIEESPEGAPEIEEITEMTECIEADVFDERTELAATEVHSMYDFSTLQEEWQRFGDSLDAAAIELLQAVYDGNADALCRDRGILPEAAYEQLNSIALEHIGDIIIENDSIIEDYSADISALLDITK